MIVSAVLCALGAVPAAAGAAPALAQTAAPRPRHIADSGKAALLVLHPGDRVEARGAVIAAPGKPVRFCDLDIPMAVATTRETCPIGIVATGVDLHRLTDRHRDHGRIVGTATIVATYRHGRLAVVEQRPFRIVPPAMTMRTVPCTAPAGGWPSGGPVNLSTRPVDQYRHAHPGSVEMLAMLRPGAHKVVMYVITTGDPAPVRAALRPDYGKRLCVVRARFSPTQIRTARHTVIAPMKRKHPPALTTPVEAGGPGLAAGTEQPQAIATVPELGAGFARRIDANPAHLIQVTVWLAPYR